MNGTSVESTCLADRLPAGTTLLVGATGTGKSWLARSLVDRLVAEAIWKAPFSKDEELTIGFRPSPVRTGRDPRGEHIALLRIAASTLVKPLTS